MPRSKRHAPASRVGASRWWLPSAQPCRSEIKSFISTSVERVEQGTALVNEAGVTLTEVVGSIKRVTDIMGEISAASTEQSAGVAQVGEAVSQMDQVTQQNAALVEESAAAAET
jgi:methyl-accepting chemotaxis protein